MTYFVKMWCRRSLFAHAQDQLLSWIINKPLHFDSHALTLQLSINCSLPLRHFTSKKRHEARTFAHLPRKHKIMIHKPYNTVILCLQTDLHQYCCIQQKLKQVLDQSETSLSILIPLQHSPRSAEPPKGQRFWIPTGKFKEIWHQNFINKNTSCTQISMMGNVNIANCIITSYLEIEATERHWRQTVLEESKLKKIKVAFSVWPIIYQRHFLVCFTCYSFTS